MERHLMKKVFLAFKLLGLLLLLSGCWDRIEINDLAIVTAAAIDKKGDDQIELSLQIFIPKSLSMGGGQGGGGAGGGAVTLIASEKGSNLSDALSKLQSELPRKVFWGQCKVFIFGEKIAKEGIQDHLDFLLRHPQPRERALVFVSEGEAKKIIEIQTELERFSAETIRELADLRVGVNITLQDLNEMLISESKAATLPYLKVITEKKKNSQFPKIIGSAVFKDDQMVGTLSEKETRGILWLRDEIEGYTVTIEPKGAKGSISLNPVSARANLVPEIYNNNWRIKAKIRTEGSVVQNLTNQDLSDPIFLKSVEKAYQEGIQRRVKLAIEKVQNELNADIVGFAKKFHRKYPKHWEQVENRWDEKFPEVEVVMEVEAYIRRQGYINEPINFRKEEVKSE